jgi:hypothetical protein
VLQRLDRLTLDEAHATGAQTLKIVYGLVQNMSVAIDGKNFLSHLTCLFFAADYPYIRHRLQGIVRQYYPGCSRYGCLEMRSGLSDWAIETMQEVVSKINKLERGLFLVLNDSIADWER